MQPEVTATRDTYLGLFVVTLATLMYEILLTRIFSVTMWYHFAFMAISLALFGMTIGAILVYLLPVHFAARRAKYCLALSALLFAVSVVLSFLVHLSLRFVPDVPAFTLSRLYPFALTYVVTAIPFAFSGVCVCLALTRFPGQVSKLYAADLAGAAVGCIALILVLQATDGPTAVVVVAMLAGIGAVLFAGEAGHMWLRRAALLCTISLAALAVANTILARHGSAWLRIRWVKGRPERPALYEKWNSFSRITVTGDGKVPREPFGWGFSQTVPWHASVRWLMLQIDSTAGTPLTAFDGDLNGVHYLRYDVTNLVHYVRPDSRVLVIGPGGGRDILAALAFRQRSITAVELNRDILDTVNRRFGAFTGHLDRDPNVTFVADEARSYVARQQDRFDIIQASLVDTWAATAAGAFVLAEQSLYTVEAWESFLRKLTPRGVLTFSRWYFPDRPGEMYRLASLARSSLERLGVPTPRRHIVIARNATGRPGSGAPSCVGTILVSREPFSGRDLNTIEGAARAMDFEIVLSPRGALDDVFAAIVSTPRLESYVAAFPINIAAPTDDSPFFFQMLRLRDMFSPRLWQQGNMTRNMKAVSVLGFLLLVVAGLTVLCIVLPLLLTTQGAARRGALPLTVFFGAIGLGFMLVEISQMQRLIVFLGHPTYGLSVVLFSLLLSSSLGSYLTQRTSDHHFSGSGRARLLLLLAALAVFGLLTPRVILAFRGSMTMVRILAATGVLCGLGLFMGMPFPLGMKAAASKSPALTPWLWGINGATSVCASVLAVAIALTSGISASFWTGFACYAVALAAFAAASRDPT